MNARERRILLEMIEFERRIWEAREPAFPEQAKGAFAILDEMEKEIKQSVYTEE